MDLNHLDSIIMLLKTIPNSKGMTALTNWKGYLQLNYLHILTCIKNKIDPSKVKPKIFNSLILLGDMNLRKRLERLLKTTAVSVLVATLYTQWWQIWWESRWYRTSIFVRGQDKNLRKQNTTCNNHCRSFITDQFSNCYNFGNYNIFTIIPETKSLNAFLIERNNILRSVIKKGYWSYDN